MKKTITTCAVAALAMLFVTTMASAQGSLTAYVVHGIPGDDLGFDRALPVDINVSGVGCAITGFAFGDRVGPIVLPAGTYDITVSLADEMNPCDGTAVIGLEGVVLPEGANGTIIAHRTADGSAGPGDLLGVGITATLFANDFAPTDPGTARLVAHHTAAAPSVDVVVSRDYSDPNAPGVTVPGFTNPTAADEAMLSQINADFRPGDWEVALEIGGAAVFGPDTLNLKPFTATYVYAVGTFPTTFQYLVFTETGLKSAGGGRSAESVTDDIDTPRSRRERRATRIRM